MRYITKYNMLACVKNYISDRHNIMISSVEYIGEVPVMIRHSCPQTGIAQLPRQIAVLYLEGYQMEVPYFVCEVCGKAYIYKDFSN